MTVYAELYTSPVPQSEPLDSRQVKNSAGGYTYALDIWKRLDRFLILGSDANTFYAKAQTLTRENAACVTACWSADPAYTALRIAEISTSGRAPKQSPALFALALGACHGLGAYHDNLSARQAAIAAVPKVCRTASHLFEFVASCRALGRGFGPTLKRAVRDWYASRPAEALAYQAIKYRERNGYTHKRMLQLAHPQLDDADASAWERRALYRWILGKSFDPAFVPPLVAAHLVAMKTPDRAELVRLIQAHRLPWEALPTAALANPAVWEAMLPHLGLTALLRNLGTLARHGLTPPLSAHEALVVRRLTDPDELARARLHPLQILTALSVYRSGEALRGSTRWEPSQAIVSALDAGFRLAFKTVVPTGKRHLLALDVSGSMNCSFGTAPLSCREASAAQALITIATEPQTHVVGFTAVEVTPNGRASFSRSQNAIQRLAIPPTMPLDRLCKETAALPFGATDCAQPMLYALTKQIPVDCFTIYTDNETWSGPVHPTTALQKYREQTGIDAKLVVVGMTSTNFTIADPQDPGMLDCVGFDTDTPAIISDFARDT